MMPGTPISFTGPLPVAYRVLWSVFVLGIIVQEAWISSGRITLFAFPALIVVAALPWSEHRGIPVIFLGMLALSCSSLLFGSTSSRVAAACLGLSGLLMFVFMERRLRELRDASE